MSKSSNEAIKGAARRWLLRMRLDSPSDHERAQWVSWCAEDPRHAAAYRRIESIWQDVATIEDLKSLVSIQRIPDPWWRRAWNSLTVCPLSRAASVTLVITASVVALGLLFRPTSYDTGIAEVRDVRLSDGSDVILGARSSLKVAFRRHERRVALTAGVAFFSVAKNASRPFIVELGNKEVRVVGTKFEIRREPDEIRVSVVEGTVEIMELPERMRDLNPKVVLNSRASIEPRAERILGAGQEVTTTSADVIPNPRAMPHGEPAAWRHGRLVYVDAPLKDVIADANRYTREPIEIAGGRIANIRVSVTYPSNQVEQMVPALARALSLDLEYKESGGLVLKEKEPRD